MRAFALAAVLLLLGPAVLTSADATPPSTVPRPLVATLANYVGTGYVAYDAAYFQGLKDSGVSLAFATVPWRLVEPAPGKYDFRLLDAFAQGARAAGLSYGWYFVESRIDWAAHAHAPPDDLMAEEERDPNGRGGGYPAFWNGEARERYFRFLEAVVSRFDSDPGFLAYYPAFGWWDAGWGPGGTGEGRGFFGYAPSTVQAFRDWLSREHGGSISRLNSNWGTAYAGFGSVPAPRPGERGFADFQRFREWSLRATYDTILSRTTARTDAAPILPVSTNGWGLYEAHTAQRVDDYFAVAQRHGALVSSTSGLGEGAPDQGARALAFARLAERRGAGWIAEPGNLPPTTTTLTRDLAGVLAGGPSLRGMTWTFEYPPHPGDPDPNSWSGTMYRETLPKWERFRLELPRALKAGGDLAKPRVGVLFSGDALHGLAPDAANDRVGYFNWVIEELHRLGVAFDVVSDHDLRDGAATLAGYDVTLDPLRSHADPAAAAAKAGWAARVAPAGAGLQVFARASSGALWLSASNTGSADRAARLEADLSAWGLPDGAYGVRVIAGAASGTPSTAQAVGGRVALDVTLPRDGFAVFELTPASAPKPTPPAVALRASLSGATVAPGGSLSGTVTLENTGGSPASLARVVLAGRPPGGTNAGGPYADFGTARDVTLAPGESRSFTFTRTFSDADSTGEWYAYPTVEWADGRWQDGDRIPFTVKASAPTVGVSLSATLSAPSVHQGETLGGTVTVRNSGTETVTLPRVALAARPPGGTNAGGPYADFGTARDVTLAAGESRSFTFSRSFSSKDPVGEWYVYPTVQWPDKHWQDGDRVGFRVETPAPAGGLSLSARLSATEAAIGGKLTGWVTLQNDGGASVTLSRVVLAARPPGGTNAGGPYKDFGTARDVTLAPGETKTFPFTRSFTLRDSTGEWYAYPTVQWPDKHWQDGPRSLFTVRSA